MIILTSFSPTTAPPPLFHASTLASLLPELALGCPWSGPLLNHCPFGRPAPTILSIHRGCLDFLCPFHCLPLLEGLPNGTVILSPSKLLAWQSLAAALPSHAHGQTSQSQARALRVLLVITMLGTQMSLSTCEEIARHPFVWNTGKWNNQSSYNVSTYISGFFVTKLWNSHSPNERQCLRAW